MEAIPTLVWSEQAGSLDEASKEEHVNCQVSGRTPGWHVLLNGGWRRKAREEHGSKAAREIRTVRALAGG